MDNFNVNITVQECLSTKCQTNNNKTNSIFKSTHDFISLNCGYTLSILSIDANYALIQISNDSIFVIRKAYVGIPINICLLNNNICCHQIKILVNSIDS